MSFCLSSYDLTNPLLDPEYQGQTRSTWPLKSPQVIRVHDVDNLGYAVICLYVDFKPNHLDLFKE